MKELYKSLHYSLFIYFLFFSKKNKKIKTFFLRIFGCKNINFNRNKIKRFKIKILLYMKFSKSNSKLKFKKHFIML